MRNGDGAGRLSHRWTFDHRNGASRIVLTAKVLVTEVLMPRGTCARGLPAGLVGGLGMAPGANIGADAAIFEAVRGSAPDIAGKGIANPTALLLAAAMMLDHVKLTEKAARLRHALDAALHVDKVRTGDLGAKATPAEFTTALVSRIANG